VPGRTPRSTDVPAGGQPAIRFDGRVAIVTGAGNGLGRAYALDLARRGARVVVNNRRHASDADGASSAERTVAAIRAAGGEAVPNWDDVRDPASGPRLIAQALDSWGRIDVLVNNAGVDQHCAFHKLSVAEFKDIFEVNFYGSLHVTHAAFGPMRAAGYGRIVVSSSSAGLHGLHGLSAYAAAKAALLGLMRSLAQEGASRGVLCNAIAPYAATRMTARHATPEFIAEMRPELVAPLVAYLVSERSRLNGEIIVAGKGGFRRAATVEGAGLGYASEAALTPERIDADRERILSMTAAREFADALAAFEHFAAAFPGAILCSTP
jgi:NAD(P)-dependent dehydrogenase (short-subunit alcohol dehydrogenase family)